MAGLHGVLAAALGAGAQVGGVAEHLREGDVGVDLLGPGAGLQFGDGSPAGVEIADHVAHILVGDDDADLHDGFQQGGIGLTAGVLEGHGSGDLEGHLGGVHLVVGPVEERDLHVHHGEAGHDARVHGAPDARVHGGDELLGDRAAHDLVDELVALAGLVGLHQDLDVAVLALAAGLTGVLGLLFHGLLDGLLIGDLGGAHVGLDLELPQEAVHDDLEMELAHTGDDGLAGLLVGPGLEGGILLGQLHQGDGHLLLTGLGLGLDGDADDGLGELHGFQDDGMLVVAEGIAGGGAFEADGGLDVAGEDLLDVLAVVGVHLEDASHAFPDALGAVEHGGPGGQVAGVDPEEAEPSHVGIGHDLEGQGGEGSVVIGGALVLPVLLRIHASDGGHVQGGGEVVHDGVQELLDPFVAVRGAAGDGDELVGHGGLADRGPDPVLIHVAALQVVLHDGVVEHGDGLQELGAVLFRLLPELLRDGLDAHVLAQVVVVDVGVHLHQVDDAPERVLAADGELDGHGVALEAVPDHVQHVIEVRPHDVHLVDVDHAGDAVGVGLTPHGLGLGLHAALGAQHRDGPVQDPQGPLYLHGEVHMAGGVDDVDAGGAELLLGPGPVTGGGGGRDGDAALLFLGHPVHGGGAVMGLADLVVDAGVEEDPLRGGGLPGVDVGHDADVPGILQRCLPRHMPSLFSHDGAPLTSGSGRRPCWLLRSCASRPAAGPRPRRCWRRP